jgi:hypothetical protein
MYTKIRGCYIVFSDAPLSDPGSLANPFVACIDQFLKVKIGDNPVGEVGPCPCNGCMSKLRHYVSLIFGVVRHRLQVFSIEMDKPKLATKAYTR